MGEEVAEVPNWLAKLEEQREKRLKVKLGHEAGAGAPCQNCGDKCPGLDLHFWRKICKLCKCGKEEHDISDDDIYGFVQFQLLGSKPSKAKSIFLAGKKDAITLDWTPKGSNTDVKKYLEELPEDMLPVKGSEAARIRKQRLQKQMPAHDIDASLCHALSPDEVQQLEEYVAHIRKHSVGQGKIIQLPLLRGEQHKLGGANSQFLNQHIPGQVASSQAVYLQSSNLLNTKNNLSRNPTNNRTTFLNSQLPNAPILNTIDEQNPEMVSYRQDNQKVQPNYAPKNLYQVVDTQNPISVGKTSDLKYPVHEGITNPLYSNPAILNAFEKMNLQDPIQSEKYYSQNPEFTNKMPQKPFNKNAQMTEKYSQNPDSQLDENKFKVINPNTNVIHSAQNVPLKTQTAELLGKHAGQNIYSDKHLNPAVDQFGNPIGQYLDKYGKPTSQTLYGKPILDKYGKPIGQNLDQYGNPIGNFDQYGNPVDQYGHSVDQNLDNYGKPFDTKLGPSGKPFVQKLDQYGKPIGQNIDKYGNPIVENLDQYGNPIGQKFDQYGKPINQNMDKYGNPIGETLDQYGKPISQKLDQYGKPVGQKLDKYGNPINDNLDMYGKPIGENLDKYGHQNAQKLDQYGKPTGQSMNMYGNPIGEMLDQFGNPVGQTLDQYGKPIVQNVDKYANPLGQTLDQYGNPIEEPISSQNVPYNIHSNVQDANYTHKKSGDRPSTETGKYPYNSLPIQLPLTTSNVERHQEQFLNQDYPESEFKNRIPMHVFNAENKVNPLEYEQNMSSVGYIRDIQYNMPKMSESDMVNSNTIPTCHRCKKIFDDGSIAVSVERTDSLWHSNCFSCHTCAQPLADLLYFYHKETDNIYCGRDYALLKGIPRCAACDELIFVREYCLAEDRTFHIKHFCCFECDEPLAGKQYLMENNQPICMDCYEKLKAERCTDCGYVIGPEEPGVSLQEFHWHATDTCFACKHCRKPLLGGGKMLLKNKNLFCSDICFKTYHA